VQDRAKNHTGSPVDNDLGIDSKASVRREMIKWLPEHFNLGWKPMLPWYDTRSRVPTCAILLSRPL
jgi:hypothetical protein